MARSKDEAVAAPLRGRSDTASVVLGRSARSKDEAVAAPPARTQRHSQRRPGALGIVLGRSAIQNKGSYVSAISHVEAALDARDSKAFATAVKNLPGSPDDHRLYDHPLIGWVARQGWAEGVEILLNAGSNPKNLPGVLHMGIFPTYLYDTDVRALELLLDAGADPNAYLPEHMGTPLQAAALVIEDRGAAITELLLNTGADPNLAPGQSATPLFQACIRPCVDTVRLLLEAGADPNAGDDDVTPLHAAISELVNAVNRSRDNPDDNSAEIARQFVPPTIELLVHHGADVTATLNGRDVIWRLLAMAEAPPGLMETLLHAGAPTDGTIEFDGESVDYLGFAMFREAPVSVYRPLVAAGCPLETRYACLDDNSFASGLIAWEPEAALTLWDEFDTVGRALLNIKTPTGASALDMAAAIAANKTLVRRLHNAGVKLTKSTVSGKTTMDMVREHQPTMIPLIEELQAAEAS